MGAINQSPPAAAVAIAASAGGVDAIRAFVAELPSDFRAAVLIVLHIPRPARVSCLRSCPGSADCLLSTRLTARRCMRALFT
jgi:hypothetical protein